MITIYGKQFCSSCEAAKTLLTQKEIEFEYKELGSDFTRDELLSKFPKARSFPQIVDGEKYVGGFEELKKHTGEV